VNWWDDEVRATLIAYAAVVGLALALLALLVALTRGPRWPILRLPIQRLRFGSWNGGSVLFHVLLWLLAGLAAHIFFERLGVYDRILPPLDAAGLDGEALKSAEHLQAVRLDNLSHPFGDLLFLAISFTLLPLLQRSAISQAGMTLVRWRRNLALGIVAFVIVTPPTLAIYVVCGQIWPAEKHPFQVLGNLQGLGLVEWSMLFVNVAVLGPVCEEWIFRGLLQGWLRRATYLEHALFVCFVGAIVGFFIATRKLSQPDVPIGLVAWTAMLSAVDLAGLYTMYRPLHVFGLALFRRPDLPPLPDGERVVDAWTVNLYSAEGHERLERPWRDFGPRWFAWKVANARWSIVGSSLLFAVVHNTWPTPIPLFFLAVVLGWLAYRTQSLVPSIVVHGLFNLVSFVAMAILSWQA
jgi:membrane protease YdiL (CAAX protease family)